MLDERRSRVLEALVEEYIRSGEPVSSRAILERSGLDVSSATVRNDLAKLESDGFVHQPHTSAGRVPTDQAYRYYVDHCSPVRLRTATRARIESFFAGVHQELGRLLKNTTSLLSEISHYPAVVIGPGMGTEPVRGLHLVHLGGPVLLAVTVGTSGRVTQEVVRLSTVPSDTELDAAETILARCFEDRTLAEGTKAVADLPTAEIPESRLRLVKAVSGALQSAETSTAEMYVGGTSQLASLWEDLTHVHTMLEILETEVALRRVLSDDTSGTSVRIGGELAMEEQDLAVVSTTYEAGGSGVGRVGVLGPLRMNYRRAIRLVEEVGEGLGDSLGR
jgi:heat-inducible transcriptional repressor